MSVAGGPRHGRGRAQNSVVCRAGSGCGLRRRERRRRPRSNAPGATSRPLAGRRRRQPRASARCRSRSSGRYAPRAVQLLVAIEAARGAALLEPLEEHVLDLALEVERDGADEVAPASSAIRRSLDLLGRSLIPGMSGAINTPAGMPAWLSFATASSRARGWACAARSRARPLSSVGTERHALTAYARRAQQ